MLSRSLTRLFAATAMFAIGCDDSTGISSSQAANVRLVNASPAAGTLGVAVNGAAQPGASGIGYPSAATECVRVDADNPQLTLQQTGGSLALPATTFAFDAGGRNTVVVAGSSAADLRVTTISDALTPELQSGQARIRVVNGRAATTMNAYVTPWNQALGTAMTINTSTGSATPWVPVTANQPVAVRVTSTTSTTPIDILNLVPTSGQELIVVAIDPAAGQTSGLQWVVTTPCSRP